MRSYSVDTDRLRMHLVESGPEDGVPVVLIHGNLSTGRFYEHLFEDAPARYRLIAPDMRGFGDTEQAPIDATRGLRDWADDTAALLDALDIDAPPHLAGWSTGGAAIAAFALERPVASLTFIDPVGPYGYGATKLDGTPHYDDFAGSRRRHRQPGVHRSAGRGRSLDRGRHVAAQRAQQLLLAADHREPPEREEMLLDEILKSVTGDDGYPGDTHHVRELARRRPGHARNPQRALAQVLQLGRDRRPATPSRRSCGRTGRTTSWSPTARRGRWARSASWASCPAGPDTFTPQPMVAQIRDVLERYAAARRARRDEMFEGSGHFPPIDARERWSGAVLRLPGVRVSRVYGGSPGSS